MQPSHADTPPSCVGRGRALPRGGGGAGVRQRHPRAHGAVIGGRSTPELLSRGPLHCAQRGSVRGQHLAVASLRADAPRDPSRHLGHDERRERRHACGGTATSGMRAAPLATLREGGTSLRRGCGSQQPTGTPVHRAALDAERSFPGRLRVGSHHSALRGGLARRDAAARNLRRRATGAGTRFALASALSRAGGVHGRVRPLCTAGPPRVALDAGRGVPGHLVVSGCSTLHVTRTGSTAATGPAPSARYGLSLALLPHGHGGGGTRRREGVPAHSAPCE